MQEELLITEISPQKKDNTHVKENIRGWIIQVLLWLTMVGGILLIIFLRQFFLMAICDIIYFIHIIYAGFTSINRYLRNKDDDNVTLFSKLNEYFTSSPVITSTVKNYHYQRNKQIFTSEDITQYPYYSSRDISGLLTLNCNNKSYVMLEIKKEIYFADPLSYSDYINRKNELWLKNNGKDQYKGYLEDRSFMNYRQYHLLRIDGKMPNQLLSCGYYWLAHFFGVGQIYNTFVDCICIHKVFTIRKVISTRHNLLLSNEAIKYDKIIPSVHLTNNTKFLADKRKIVTIKEDYPYKPFSKEQVDEANKYYGRFVPNYTTTYVLNAESEIVNDLYGFTDKYNGELNNDVICNVTQEGTANPVLIVN